MAINVSKINSSNIFGTWNTEVFIDHTCKITALPQYLNSADEFYPLEVGGGYYVRYSKEGLAVYPFAETSFHCTVRHNPSINSRCTN